MNTLHLMTQDNQPYGSERKCCEECGKSVFSDSFPKDHRWTDDRDLFQLAYEYGYNACSAVVGEVMSNGGSG